MHSDLNGKERRLINRRFGPLEPASASAASIALRFFSVGWNRGSLRQPKIMFPFKPCARAMFATEAPGTSASATTRFLKPTEYLPLRASRQVAILDVHLTAKRTSKSAN